MLFDTLLQDWESKTDEADGEKTKSDPAAEAEGDTADGAGAGKKDGEEEKAVKKGCSNQEVVAVLSHELGHWSMNHVFKNIVLIQVCDAEKTVGRPGNIDVIVRHETTGQSPWGFCIVG